MDSGERTRDIKQVTSVEKYYWECRRSVEAAHGEINASNDHILLSRFIHGLKDKIKNRLCLTTVTDSDHARRLALEEEKSIEMADANKKRSSTSDERYQRLEQFNASVQEEMRKQSGAISALHKELQEVRVENHDMRRLLEATYHLLKNQSTKPDGDVQTKILDELQTVKLNVKDLQTTVRALATKNTADMKMEMCGVQTALGSLEEKLEHTYSWTRQVHEDMPKEEPRERQPRALLQSESPQDSRSRKRSLSRPQGRSLSRESKQARVYSPEMEAMHFVETFLQPHEIDEIVSATTLTIGVNRMYDALIIRVREIKNWMRELDDNRARKEPSKECSLCDGWHYSYSCPEFVSIKDRRNRLESMGNFCPQCWIRHPGRCQKELSCWVCERAKMDGRIINGGIKHPRMMCPLREEHVVSLAKAEKLMTVKKILEKK